MKHLILLYSLAGLCGISAFNFRSFFTPTKNTSLSKICGTRPAINKWKTRIINGKNADYGSSPWIVNIKYLNHPMYYPVDQNEYEDIEYEHYGHDLINYDNLIDKRIGRKKNDNDDKYFLPTFHLCGGTVITPDWVISAAHCFKGRDDADKELYLLKAGDNDVLKTEDYEQNRIATKVLIHPEYDSWDNTNDWTLLQAHKKFDFSTNYVKPACIMDATKIQNLGENSEILTKPDKMFTCTIAGWGNMREHQGLPTTLKLKQANVTLLTNKKCEAHDLDIDNSMTCAHDVKFHHFNEDIDDDYNYIDGSNEIESYEDSPGNDACQGDSGGPLTCKVSNNNEYKITKEIMKDRHYLFGVTSWGFGCGEKLYPGVWANTWSYGPFYEWLVQETDLLVS